MTKGCWSLRNAIEAKRNKSVGRSLEMSHTIGRSLGKSRIGRKSGESMDSAKSGGRSRST